MKLFWGAPETRPPLVINRPSEPMTGQFEDPFYIVNYGQGLCVDDKSEKFSKFLDQEAIGKLNKSDGKKMVIEDGAAYHRIITDAAEKAEYFSGKWNIVCQTDVVDSIWKIIAELCYNGKLGPTVKVARKSERFPGHVLCIYTDDYRNTEKVKKLYQTFTQALESGGFKDKYTVTGFKCDYYTEMGITESQNLPPGTVTEDGVYNKHKILIKTGMSEMLYTSF